MGSALDATDAVVETTDGLAIQVPCLREPVAFSILVDGSYEAETWKVIKAYLPANGVFVDVGANVGLFSLQVAKHIGLGGRVLAIEASEQIFAYLQRNIRSSGVENADCLQIAVTDQDGVEMEFYDAPVEHFGMGSLAPQFNAAPKLVVGRTLDKILNEMGIQKVDVIKVDVEGFEASVFRGAIETLTAGHKPIIVFEFLDWAEKRAGENVGAAQSVILSYGYNLRRIDESGAVEEILAEPVKQGGTMLVATPIAGNPRSIRPTSEFS
jgi:FkbM family methyltransferase